MYPVVGRSVLQYKKTAVIFETINSSFFAGKLIINITAEYEYMNIAAQNT